MVMQAILKLTGEGLREFSHTISRNGSTLSVCVVLWAGAALRENDKRAPHRYCKHICFGLHNFKNLRNRILFCSTCA